MFTGMRHTAVLVLGLVLVALVMACGDPATTPTGVSIPEPTPDIKATVEARVELAKASLVAPTAAPLPTYTPLPTFTPAPAAPATAAKPAAKAEAPTQTYYMIDLLREKHSNDFVFDNKYDGSSLWVSGGTISSIGDCGLDFGDDDTTKACVSVQVPLESVLPVIKIGEDYLYIGGVTCRLRSQSDVLTLRVGNSVLVEGLYVPSHFSHVLNLKDCTVTVF